MLDRHRRGAIRLVPVGRSQMQLGDDLGLDPAQLAEQELPKEPVIAVPLAAPVVRNQEQVRRLQAVQPVLGARLAEQGVAQRSREPIQHRGPTQKPLIIPGNLANDSR